MTTPVRQPVATPRTLSPEEGYAYFDGVVRKAMKISADEFIARWRAGEFEWDESRQLDDLLSLLPMALHRDEH